VKYAVFFYLLILIWAGVVVYRFGQLCRQQGPAWAVASVYRLLLDNHLFPVGPDIWNNKPLLTMGLLVKAGELLGLGLLIRIFWLTHWAEAVLILLILAAVIYAFYYLASCCREDRKIRSVYSLSEEYGVYEIVLGPSGTSGAWVGTTLAQLDLRRKELLVLSIVREGKVIIFPKGPEVLLGGDRLLVFGKTTTLPEKPLTWNQ
jgi:hypothetical protein